MNLDEKKPVSSALETLPDIILEFGARGGVRQYIGGGATDTVISPGTLPGRNIRECWPQQAANDVIRQIRKSLSTRKPGKFQLAFAEQPAVYEVRLYPRGRDSVLAVLRNIENEADVRGQQRLVDTLTGLSTRERFLVELEGLLERERLRERQVALIHINIHRFSLINQTLGRETGDEVLRTVASRIHAGLRADNQAQSGKTGKPPVLARIGGDRFVMLVSNIGTQHDARNLARRIRESLAEPIPCDNLSVPIEPRIGIALFPQDGDDAEALLDSARMAVNHAQDYAVQTGVFYSDQLRALGRKTDAAQELRWAIEANQLELHYLPRISFADRAVTGLECVLRWRHPMRGLLGTDQITPLAETIGVMGQISDWMLQQGCRFAHNLSAEHGPPPALAITLTEREFARPDLIDRVAASLDDAGLDRKRLQLEITERALMRFRQGPARIRQLKALGLRVALDNFGSGHVSLSALAALPIDALKIDRQFSQIMGSEAVSQRLCAAVIALGRELGLTVIAKGIENPLQHALLVELGCDAGQGLLFSQPLAPGEIPAFLASQGNLPQPSPVA